MSFADMDPKTKKEVMIIGALVPVLLILVWMNFVAPAMRRQAAIKEAAARQASAPSAAASPSASAAPARPAPAEEKARIEAYETAAWKGNPFQGPRQEAPVVRAPQAATPTFRLQGIVYDPPNSSAVIDGEVRGVGDTIGEFLIIDITKDRVSLRKRTGQVLDLQLFPDMR